MKLEINKFDLLGNIQDGFDCNDAWNVWSFEAHSADTAEDLALKAEHWIKNYFSKTLPLTENGNDETTFSGADLEIEWSDELYADIIVKEHGVIVGSVTIQE